MSAQSPRNGVDIFSIQHVPYNYMPVTPMMDTFLHNNCSCASLTSSDAATETWGLEKNMKQCLVLYIGLEEKMYYDRNTKHKRFYHYKYSL